MNIKTTSRLFFIFYFLFIISLPSCKEEVVDFDANNCKGNPAFIKRLGFEPKLSYFSTTNVHVMGVQLLQSQQAGNAQAPVTKTYQHPSWIKGGRLAPILVDADGNIFTSPAPFVNMFDNPIANNNSIYRIDANTGVMEEFMRLPMADSINPQNPYGIIGMAYLCETGILFVSSVAGSSLHKEAGHIYCIDVKNKKIIDQLNNTDAMGMGISYAAGKRQLFFGTGRNSDVQAITLNDEGKFKGSPQTVFTIQNLGARGDDKVRKIRADNSGNLSVYGMEFNFNLIAPREKQETLYRYNYDEAEKKWIYQPNL